MQSYLLSGGIALSFVEVAMIAGSVLTSNLSELYRVYFDKLLFEHFSELGSPFSMSKEYINEIFAAELPRGGGLSSKPYIPHPEAGHHFEKLPFHLRVLKGELGYHNPYIIPPYTLYQSLYSLPHSSLGTHKARSRVRATSAFKPREWRRCQSL